MKKTKYYFEVVGFYNEICDWGHISSAAAEKGILLYKEKSTGEVYCYEDITDYTLQTGYYVWQFKILRTEEVDIEPGVTKLEPYYKYKNGMNWKNVQVKGANSRLRKPNPPKKPDSRPPINPRTGLRDGGV